MSLLPAYFGARRRKNDDLAPPEEPESTSRDDVFNLIPPRANENAEPIAAVDPPAPVMPEPPAAEAKPIGRNRHPVEMTDLTRLSIDNDGRLYWDGKPVEVRRSLLMSRAQIAGLIVIATLVAIAAFGAAVQAGVAMHDFGCRAGWTATLCPPATPMFPSPAPPARIDIPA